MLSKLLIIFFFLFANTHSVATSANQHIECYCAPQLQEAFSLLQQMPEVNALIDKIEKDGPFSIEMNRGMSKKFEGYWSPDYRTVCVTPNHSLAGNITTILFEMHNAANQSTLDYYDNLAYNREISRKDYIRAIEHWEYENALATAKILNKGIEMGLFPRECYWPVHDNFEEHFELQKSAGHSAYVGKMYDSLI